MTDPTQVGPPEHKVERTGDDARAARREETAADKATNEENPHSSDLQELIRQTEENLARLKAAIPPGQAKKVDPPSPGDTPKPPKAVGVYASPHLVWAGAVIGNGPTDRDHEKWVRSQARYIERLKIDRPRFDLPILEDQIAHATVIRNCWIARCPWCRGEEGIWAPDDWFYCLSCGNQATKGQRITIGFAVDPLRVATILEARPDPLTRNWLPHETEATIISENAENNIPPPPVIEENT